MLPMSDELVCFASTETIKYTESRPTLGPPFNLTFLHMSQKSNGSKMKSPMPKLPPTRIFLGLDAAIPWFFQSSLILALNKTIMWLITLASSSTFLFKFINMYFPQGKMGLYFHIIRLYTWDQIHRFLRDVNFILDEKKWTCIFMFTWKRKIHTHWAFLSSQKNRTIRRLPGTASISSTAIKLSR